MHCVVAAKTAGIVGVAEVIRIRAPSDFEVREHIALVDGRQGLSRRMNRRALFDGNIRVFLEIERAQGSGDLLRRFVVARVLRLEQFNAFLLDEGQAGRDLAVRHGLVDRTVRELERVRGSIVAIGALHLEGGNERTDTGLAPLAR